MFPCQRWDEDAESATAPPAATLAACDSAVVMAQSQPAFLKKSLVSPGPAVAMGQSQVAFLQSKSLFVAGKQSLKRWLSVVRPPWSARV